MSTKPVMARTHAMNSSCPARSQACADCVNLSALPGIRAFSAMSLRKSWMAGTTESPPTKSAGCPSRPRRRGQSRVTLSQFPLAGRRQILAGEDVLGCRLVLEVVGQRDLVDRFGEPRHVDAAEAVGFHPWRHEIVAQRHFQPVEFDLRIGSFVARHHRLDCRVRILDRIEYDIIGAWY